MRPDQHNLIPAPRQLSLISVLTTTRQLVGQLCGAMAIPIGTVRNSVYGRSIERHGHAMAWVKRSPNRTANWALAMDHSRGGIVHSFSLRCKTRNSSFSAASSVGK